MQLRVDGGIWLPLDAPARLVERFRRALSFDNPAYVQALRMRRSTFGLSPVLCLLHEGPEGYRAPRGSIGLLRRLAGEESVRLDVEDRRVAPALQPPLVPMRGLRDYQSEGIRRLARLTQGLALIVCGGGKTRLGVGAIGALGMRTLVLVGSIDLAEQWRENIRTLLDIEAGFVGDGEQRPGQVTVAVVQALMNWPKQDLDHWLAGFGMVILDEAHHVAARVFSEVVDRAPAKYRLGLTATPEREDGLTPLLECHFGPVLVDIGHGELIERGLLVRPTIATVPTGFRFPYEKPRDYAPMMAALIADEERNQVIVDLVTRDASDGHSCLVLTGRLEHCRTLEELLRERGVGARALTGQLKRGERTRILEDARSGALSVLIATSIADEGLDLPRLSRVVLAYPAKAKGRTEQRLGRLMRPHPGKAGAVLYDIADLEVPLLRRHHLSRRAVYADVLGVAPELSGPRSTTRWATDAWRAPAQACP